jgi:hypothetical protein
VISLASIIPASAATLEPSQTYSISLDTAPLESDTADEPFSLSFVFTGGGAAGDANTVTLSDFNFDNGSPGPTASIASTGDVSTGSSLASGITLDTVGGVSSSFRQTFNPGDSLTLILTTTEDLVDPSTATPDMLAVYVDDPGDTPLATTSAGIPNVIVAFGYDFPANVAPPHAAAVIITGAGAKLVFPAPVITPIPEPASLILLLIPAAAIWSRTSAAARGLRKC